MHVLHLGGAVEGDDGPMPEWLRDFLRHARLSVVAMLGSFLVILLYSLTEFAYASAAAAVAGVLFIALAVGKFQVEPRMGPFLAPVVVATSVLLASVDAAYWRRHAPDATPMGLLAGMASLLAFLVTRYLSRDDARDAWRHVPSMRQAVLGGSIFTLVQRLSDPLARRRARASPTAFPRAWSWPTR